MRMTKHDLYCPKCGTLGIWQDADDPGDYYAGTAMWCFECRSLLPDISVSDPWDDRQGQHGKAFAVERYERHRSAALGKEKP